MNAGASHRLKGDGDARQASHLPYRFVRFGLPVGDFCARFTPATMDVNVIISRAMVPDILHEVDWKQYKLAHDLEDAQEQQSEIDRVAKLLEQ